MKTHLTKIIGIALVLSLTYLVSCAQQQKGIYMVQNSTLQLSENATDEEVILKAAHTVPTKQQYEFKKDEFTCFIHFGPNTFTAVEWGSGFENPEVFTLENLDTDQWCETMKAANMTKVIITSKHHDGFCLWQSRYTKHGVMSSSFRDGKGDIMKDLSESCEKYGIKLGVYLSPADLFQIESKEGLYGNLSKTTKRTIPRPVEGRPFANKTTFSFEVDDYNEYFLNQLFELLTEYGPVHEVWFDGAHPKRKGGQTYNYLAWKELIYKLAPDAVVFGKEGVRWCGNEGGKTRDSEWDVLPFQEDPHQKHLFGDIQGDIGGMDKLRGGKYFHYLPAETNTSIRAGWFYRNDTEQQVRNADDVFDIYERSVGGNSTFLLNLPPTTEGVISQREVSVLKDVGERIRNTYGVDLFENAKGPKQVLDNKELTYNVLESGESIEISTPNPVTINRFLIQESITTHSMRVKSHALDAWVNDEWKEIATGTTIGYKKILRFADVTSSKFRLRILDSRLEPAISKISAHYYTAKPPQLTLKRDNDGLLTISKENAFGWKRYADQTAEGSSVKIYYTTDGTTPTKKSNEYTEPFVLNSGIVNAIAFVNAETGSIAKTEFGVLKNNWTVKASSQDGSRKSTNIFDNNSNSFWKSKSTGHPQYVSIDLGEKCEVAGFNYTPWAGGDIHKGINAEGMIEKGVVKVSDNGKTWKTVETFEFGNLINDPTPRSHYLQHKITTRYIRIESERGARDSKCAIIAELDILGTYTKLVTK